MVEKTEWNGVITGSTDTSIITVSPPTVITEEQALAEEKIVEEELRIKEISITVPPSTMATMERAVERTSWSTSRAEANDSAEGARGVAVLNLILIIVVAITFSLCNAGMSRLIVGLRVRVGSGCRREEEEGRRTGLQ